VGLSRFDDVLKTVLGFEGGYANDPNDRGGETNLGITAGTLARAFKDGLVKSKDVSTLTRPEAATIYRRYYWDKCRCDELPEPLDLLIFDSAVNSGTGGAIKMLQEAINALLPGNPLELDGSIGPKTLALLDKIRKISLDITLKYPELEPGAILRYLCLDTQMNKAELYDWLADRDPTQRKFVRGWWHQRVIVLSGKAGMEG